MVNLLTPQICLKMLDSTSVSSHLALCEAHYVCVCIPSSLSTIIILILEIQFQELMMNPLDHKITVMVVVYALPYSDWSDSLTLTASEEPHLSAHYNGITCVPVVITHCSPCFIK